MLVSIRRLGLVLASATLLIACSAGGTPSSAPAASSSGPSASTGGGAVTVGTSTGALGTYLTGKDGKTLYVLTKDNANTSTCSGACAATWPPFTVSGSQAPTAGGGITGTLATFARADGTTQVTINAMPLYYYSGDTKAGDTNGQGKFGVWFVAPASGQLTVPSATPSKGGYGY